MKMVKTFIGISIIGLILGVISQNPAMTAGFIGWLGISTIAYLVIWRLKQSIKK